MVNVAVGPVPDSAPDDSEYAPDSTRGVPAPITSPGVTASRDAGNVRCTVRLWPAASVTRVNAISRFGGTRTPLTGWLTYTGTTRSPDRVPVLDTVTVTPTVSFGRTVGRSTATAPNAYEVYDRPAPNGNA